jgi:hypothetical protein
VTVGAGHLDAVIREQHQAEKLSVNILWNNKYKRQFPKLFEPAVRLLTMGTQSADVERCCKVHKIVHSRPRNRLKNKNVVDLVYCYVNLRLLKRLDQEGTNLDDNDDLEEFLADAILQE